MPDGADPGGGWEKEWQRHLLDAACERIARKVNARHYQVFHLCIRQQLPVPKEEEEDEQ